MFFFVLFFLTSFRPTLQGPNSQENSQSSQPSQPAQQQNQASVQWPQLLLWLEHTLSKVFFPLEKKTNLSLKVLLICRTLCALSTHHSPSSLSYWGAENTLPINPRNIPDLHSLLKIYHPAFENLCVSVSLSLLLLFTWILLVFLSSTEHLAPSSFSQQFLLKNVCVCACMCFSYTPDLKNILYFQVDNSIIVSHVLFLKISTGFSFNDISHLEKS